MFKESRNRRANTDTPVPAGVGGSDRPSRFAAWKNGPFAACADEAAGGWDDPRASAPNRLGTGLRIAPAGAAIVRPAPEVHFSARPAAAPWPDGRRRHHRPAPHPPGDRQSRATSAANSS